MGVAMLCVAVLVMDSPIEQKKKKVNQVYEYSKDWTAHDFYGKYHLQRIKNPVPIPGTQIQLEYQHQEKKSADIKRYEQSREQQLLETQKLLELKKQSTEVGSLLLLYPPPSHPLLILFSSRHVFIFTL
jgi:hypothetical protein